jgi:hypothetical protein
MDDHPGGHDNAQVVELLTV